MPRSASARFPHPAEGTFQRLGVEDLLAVGQHRLSTKGQICRWKGSVSSYLDRSGLVTHVHSDSFQKPPSSDGTFWSDSGRIYGERAGYLAGQRIKMCQDDWIYDNGQGAIGNGAVHFRGITGIDYGTFNMADWCTGWFYAAIA